MATYTTTKGAIDPPALAAATVDKVILNGGWLYAEIRNTHATLPIWISADPSVPSPATNTDGAVRVPPGATVVELNPDFSTVDGQSRGIFVAGAGAGGETYAVRGLAHAERV
jgi:hypothetical protein